jgi:hypothetical protein
MNEGIKREKWGNGGYVAFAGVLGSSWGFSTDITFWG